MMKRQESQKQIDRSRLFCVVFNSLIAHNYSAAFQTAMHLFQWNAIFVSLNYAYV